MASRKNVLSHIIRHSQWPHVQVAYVQTVEVDGESFTKPTEVNLDSPAIVKAAKALEDAVLKEIDAERPEVPMAAPTEGEQAQSVQNDVMASRRVAAETAAIAGKGGSRATSKRGRAASKKK